jgi:hypothetical protein
MVECVVACAYHAHVDHCYRPTLIAREYACSAQRIWHARYEHITRLEKRAPELICFTLSEKSLGFIDVNAIANICELNEANATVWVLVLALHPITIDEHSARTN